MRILADLLDEPTPNRRLLGLWLRKCSERSWVLPPTKLPTLFDLFAKTNYADYHNDLRNAAGERGRWLSRFNTAWNYVVPPSVEVVWGEGNSNDRIFAFRHLRLADPANALACCK